MNGLIFGTPDCSRLCHAFARDALNCFYTERLCKVNGVCPAERPRFRRVREIQYGPAYRNDELIRLFLLATSFARVLHRPLSLPENRGRREDRVHAAPAISCAIAHKERAHEHTGTGGASRPSLRNGFTTYFVLSPVNGFLATVVALSRNLTPAPRRPDHTTSPYASGAYV